MLRRLAAGALCALAPLGAFAPAGAGVPRHHAVNARRSQWPVPEPWLRAKLERIAWCESRGNWHIATGNGFFGGLQFLPSTWRAMGGSGLPSWASKEEQMYRGARLYRATGGAAWPICRWA
jgi:hypothetical protein